VYGDDISACIVTSIPPEKAITLQPNEAKAEVKQLGISGKFILFVGTLEPRKNIAGLLRAYAQLPNALRHIHSLVLAGALGWNSQEIAAALHYAHRTKLAVIYTGYISNRQKTALYMQADLLVQPSLYEGFGMPILEAMSHDLPVIASDIQVFHEVADKAALYVDPRNTAELAAAIEHVLTDEKTYAALKQKSKKYVHEYRSWEQIAVDVHHAIGQVVKQH
jgi:glycosyltransferase involved in cell wall biosynthesis